MKSASHQTLGRYLVKEFLEDAPRRYIRAFLIGCIEPDRNPATYFKGSIRSQWLRGHNWGNSRNYINRLTLRLERRKNLHIWDFYSLGKLIHYTTDAFTDAHNSRFTTDLSVHNSSEQKLQEYFLSFMATDPSPVIDRRGTMMGTISAFHHDYLRLPGNAHTDTEFTLTACCTVMSILFAPRRCLA